MHVILGPVTRPSAIRKRGVDETGVEETGGGGPSGRPPLLSEPQQKKAKENCVECGRAMLEVDVILCACGTPAHRTCCTSQPYSCGRGACGGECEDDL